MHRLCAVFVVFYCTSAVWGQSIRSEQLCVDYYKTGEAVDLNDLLGDWYAVYYWPPIQRQREECGVVKFKKIEASEMECRDKAPLNETIFKSSYKNSAGKSVQIFYYGSEEVKHQIRSCNRVSKYIFVDVDDDYVMGINCSSGGRGVLLSKVLPKSSEVLSVVEDIEVMSGRQGSPDCPLK